MINKYANLYDIDGKLINTAPLHDMTIEEVEKLLDEYTEKSKSFPDNEVYKVYLNNLYRWLMYLYQTQGNPHKDELIQKINDNQVIDALNEVKEDVEQQGSEEPNTVGGDEPVSEDKSTGDENN